jgi:aspartate racemase
MTWSYFNFFFSFFITLNYSLLILNLSPHFTKTFFLVSFSGMQHIGIVGVTAEGGALCYKTIVQESAGMLGEYHHPEISLNNQEFAQIVQAQRAEQWEVVTELLLLSLQKLHAIGADLAIIPANSVHFVIEELKQKSPVTILSILDAVANVCEQRGYAKVSVLGVGITMSRELYKPSLHEAGVSCIVPDLEDQKVLNDVIYNELVKGIFRPETTNRILKIIEKQKTQGAEAVILGCTELPLVITSQNSPLAIIDSTRELAIAAAKVACGKEGNS